MFKCSFIAWQRAWPLNFAGCVFDPINSFFFLTFYMFGSNKIEAYSWTCSFLYIRGIGSLFLNLRKNLKDFFFYWYVQNNFLWNILHLFQPGTLVLLMVTNIVLVCDAQHFLFVHVHLFVSFNPFITMMSFESDP